MFRSSLKAPPRQVLPGVNTLVKLQLTVPDGSGPRPLHLSSRVEDVDQSWPEGDPLTLRSTLQTRLYVAAPHYPGDLEEPAPGSPCQVTWPTPVGLCELPTRYEGRVRVGPAVRAWRLAVTAPATRAQRRRYFRVPWISPVTLEIRGPAGAEVDGLEDGDGPPGRLQVFTGTTVDLSEGGLRVGLPTPGLPDGTPIRALLPIRDQILVIPATTVWHRTAPVRASRLVEVGVSFDDVELYGDLLRQVVVDEQLRARRLGLS
ncbi:MAG TPA: PilZ domain-containing protein [Kineosporiaceae bacterium]|nr:PilZ domain-containing protein [Kineosporiaceae bacterium]